MPWVASGKWNVPEEEISGHIVNVVYASESNPVGQYAEFVIMPVIIFQTNSKGIALLNQHADNVPDDMGDVSGYEWVSAKSVTHENAMTKVVAAAEFIKAYQP